MRLDGQLPHQTSNKHYHHGGSIWCYNDMMAMVNKATPPLGASSEGVRQGWCGWVLFIYADRLRNKLITKLYNLF